MNHPSVPQFEPVPEGTTRPFWSVMVPIYNCPANYLRETLQSVLCQDPGAEELQIEVIDNCSSTDDPEAIVHEIGAGRISFHRQPANVGVVENCNTCIRRARGHWVHILHGDDTVREDFYARARQGIGAFPDVGAAFCRVIYMDETSQWTGLTEPEARLPGVLGKDFAVRQFLEQRIQFVAMVVRRSTYEELGGFRPSLAHCVDWDMWKRIAMRKQIFYDPQPLACYRLHTAADTSRLIPDRRERRRRAAVHRYFLCRHSARTGPAHSARSHGGSGDPCGPPRAAAMEGWRPCHSLAPAPGGHTVQPRACGSHPHGLLFFTCLLALKPAVDGNVASAGSTPWR